MIAGVDVSLIEQLETIRSAIDEIMTSCSRVTTDISETSRVSQMAVVDVSAAERAVERAWQAVRDAERLLKTEGQEALREAAEKQRELGHQSNRMTVISREARELADRCAFSLILLLLGLLLPLH